MNRVSSLGRRRQRTKSIELCSEDATIPAVGGISVEDAHLNRYPLLPPHVVLYEPTKEDIWLSPGKLRGIFLNQPLMPFETDALKTFVDLVSKAMNLKEGEPLPRWIRPHMTRLLQQTKYKPEPAVKLYETLYEERAKKLPIAYADIKKYLETGFIYWHGRDARCRPLLTIRLGRATELIGNGEAVKMLMLFNMEFATRHLLVPGRVENWVVIIDCAGIEELPNLMKCKSLGQAIADTMGKVYSGRMVWTKIFNFPKGLGYRSVKWIVEGIVAALGKSDKVSFVSDNANADFKGQVHPGNLEQCFGGTAPDLAPHEVFPYRMFATPEGYSASPSADAGSASLHNETDLAFHEGYILADCMEPHSQWREAIRTVPLPPEPAAFVNQDPVRSLSAWNSTLAAIPRTFSSSNAEDFCNVKSGKDPRQGSGVITGSIVSSNEAQTEKPKESVLFAPPTGVAVAQKPVDEAPELKNVGKPVDSQAPELKDVGKPVDSQEPQVSDVPKTQELPPGKPVFAENGMPIEEEKEHKVLDTQDIFATTATPLAVDEGSVKPTHFCGCRW
eukprot:TRINITY_DN7800_c0_g1_i3.p1 TRINITY_DN7800_c0_g1~~TRINITY_DN7800_c0_g1_i3.p1  ORF type:complete len:559 (+),score=75.79 TRINITY_DN7800_c0_g1_i3:93-1769(+)